MGRCAQAAAPRRWPRSRIPRFTACASEEKQARPASFGMTRIAFAIAACLLAAACASDPGVRTADRNAPAIRSGTHEDTRSPAGPAVYSGDGTPAIGTGIRPSDSGLGLMPGFPVGR
jgi:hypothetical protein